MRESVDNAQNGIPADQAVPEEKSNSSSQLWLIRLIAGIGVFVEIGLVVFMMLSAWDYGARFDINDCMAFVDGEAFKKNEEFKYSGAVALHFLKPKLSYEKDSKVPKISDCDKFDSAKQINSALSSGVPHFANLGLKGYWPQLSGVGGMIFLCNFLMILYLGALSGVWELCFKTEEESEAIKKKQKDEVDNASWCDVWFNAFCLCCLGALGLFRVMCVFIAACKDPCGFKMVAYSLNKIADTDDLGTDTVAKAVKDAAKLCEIACGDLEYTEPTMDGADEAKELRKKRFEEDKKLTDEELQKIKKFENYTTLLDAIDSLKADPKEPKNIEATGFFSTTGKCWQSRYWKLKGDGDAKAIDDAAEETKLWKDFKNYCHDKPSAKDAIKCPGAFKCTFGFWPFWITFLMTGAYCFVGVQMLRAACANGKKAIKKMVGGKPDIENQDGDKSQGRDEETDYSGDGDE